MEKRLSVLNGVHSCPRAVAHWSRPELEKSTKDTSKAQANKGCANPSDSQVPVLSIKDFSPVLLKTFPPSKHSLVRQRSFDSGSFLHEMLSDENDANVLGDQKSLVKGFQTVEMIDRILDNFLKGKDYVNELFSGFPNFIHISLQLKISPAAKFSSQNVRCLAFYRDKLLHLLSERCYLGLQKECVLHIKELKGFVSELIALKRDETEQVHLHLHGNGKSITGIYFGKKNKLLEHLQQHCLRWPVIQQHVNRMISIFHVNWDCRLNELLYFTERTLKSLLTEAFYWTVMILQDDFSILCSKDQHSLPSDVLQNFYNSLNTFNTLLGNQLYNASVPNPILCRECVGIVHGIKCLYCDMQDFVTSFALQMLATFQSQIAARNIVDVLTAEWRNCENVEMEHGINWTTEMEDIERPLSDNRIATSDYYTNSESASSSNTKENCRSTLEDDTSSFCLNSALFKVIQRNQTSLLKHLFAITCIGSFSHRGEVAKLEERGNAKGISVGRQKWPRAYLKAGSESSSLLERVYWLQFWRKLETSILGLTLYSCGQPLKNRRLGNVAFLPSQFVVFLTKKIKDAKCDVDLSVEALMAIHKVSQRLFITIALGVWDESLNKSLRYSTGNRYTPVPLTNGNVGTNVGKLFFCSLEPATCLALSAISFKEDYFMALALCCVQSTLSCIISWASSKLDCLLNSWNITTFFLITLTDLSNCRELFTLFLELQETSVSGNNKLSWKLDIMNDQLQELIDHAGGRVFDQTYSKCCDILRNFFPKAKYWRRRKLESKLLSCFKEELLECILQPSLSALSKAASVSRLTAASKLSTAMCEAWIDHLFSRRIYFSSVGAYQLKSDLQFFLKWVQESDLCPQIKSEFLRSDGCLRLNAITKVLSGEDEKLKSETKRNQVSPADADRDDTVCYDVLPSWNFPSHELEVWKSLKIYYPCLCFYCWD